MIRAILLCVVLFLCFWCYEKILPLPAEKGNFGKVAVTEKQIEEIKEILSQPLAFLGYGSQCFVFLTQDQQYVVKICRSSRYHWLFTTKGKLKKEADFLSYRFAYESIPEESQVTFLHLNETKNLNMQFSVIDSFGFSHVLDADLTAFYIQKKAIPLPDYLKTLSTSETKDLAKKLLRLFQGCSEKGLQVKDIYSKNIGIYAGSPLWIDPGRIVKKESLKAKSAQEKALRKFTKLLKPSLPLDFSRQLEEELNECLN